jgi:hypothetical protein
LVFHVKKAFFQQARFVSTRNWRLVYALGVVLGRWFGGSR